MNLTFISDTHSLHDRLPAIDAGDVLIHCGDFTARGTLDDGELDAALAGTYLRNARGMLIRRRWAAGTALARRAWGLSRDPAQRREIAGLLPFGVKRFLRGLMPG